MDPAARNNHPIVFRGLRDTRRIPRAGTAMFTATLRTFEKVHRSEEAFPPAGRATPRSMNIKTMAPIIRAIDRVPTDHAIQEAVLCFIPTDSDG
jgi:hypothetical protein